MRAFQKKGGSSAVYEPVAWDRSITKDSDGSFKLTIRSDDDTFSLRTLSLERAVATLELFTPEVFEGPDVPMSVFFRGKVANEALW